MENCSSDKEFSRTGSDNDTIRLGLMVFFISFLVVLLTVPIDNTPGDANGASANLLGETCVSFDSAKRLISIACKSARLSDIANQLHNSSIISLEKQSDNDGKLEDSSKSSKIWILRAGIVVKENATLIIDSNDTTWLKIVPIQTKQPPKTVNQKLPSEDQVSADGRESETNENVISVSKNNGDSPNGIHVFGSLKIDSVKMTSWDTEKNDVVKFSIGKRSGEEHTKSDYDTAEPRPFIRVSVLATGTTNITNSEIAYLGYSCSRCSGLSYYGGEGSVIEGNNIHHLLKGFYSKGMGSMIIEGNKFHDNYLYGIDPHTGSHDIIIRNNMVHHNNASGIICSKDCYNLLIEGNKVHNNGGAGRGIAFSINTTHSIARNNFVFDHPRCISFNRASDYNEVYDNNISHCKIGIYLANTSNNVLHDNKIARSDNAIMFKNVTNRIFDNRIDDTTNGIVITNSTNNSNYTSHTDNGIKNILYKDSLNQIKKANKITDTKNPILLINQPVKSVQKLEVLADEKETTAREEKQ